MSQELSDATSRRAAGLWPGVIERYRDRLPVTGDTPVITLYEGGTPLLRAAALCERIGCLVYLEVDGNFDDCLELARKLAVDYPVALVNSLNPDRLEGQKTAAFEICDALGRAPDVHCLPVGNAGNIVAYWSGYREYARDGLVDSTP